VSSPQIARKAQGQPESSAVGAPGPTILVIGGIDPGGGAGLLRDVTTVRALGARAHAVGTAWTEQGAGVHQVEPRDPQAISDAVARAVRERRPGAAKIGMAVGPATADALLAGLTAFAAPVVVDPVLATSRGGALWAAPPERLLPLLRRASLVTPNAPEAALLTGRSVRSLEDAEAAGAALVQDHGLPAVLVKGGHLGVPDDPVTDLLITARGSQRFQHARMAGLSPRGTGCALATAVAVALGRGADLAAAVESAIAWLSGAIAGASWTGDERHLGS